MISKFLFSTLWLAAFLCSLFFIDDWQLEQFGTAVVFLFVWAVIMLSQNDDWQVPKSWVLRIMGLFWLLAFLSIFRSEILNVSVMAFCFITVMPLTFLVFTVQGNEKQFVFIAKALAVVFAGLAVWSLLQFFVYHEYFGGRAYHPLNNPNSLGALFNLGFFCAVGWMLGAKERLHSNLALVLSIIIFSGIVATASRGAFFSMIPAMALLLFVMREQAWQHWRRLSILLVFAVGVFTLSGFGAVESDNLINRVSDTVALNLSNLSSNRVSLWMASWEMIKVHGLLGTGIGTYFLYFPEFRLVEDRWGTYYAHSDPLQYWVELGFLGPVLFYAFAIAVTGRTIQAIRKTKDVTQRLMILTPFSALGAVILHTHVTFNLYNLSILFGVGFLLAVWFQATQKVLATATKNISFPENYSFIARVLSISFPFLFIGALFLAYISSEHFTNKARDHLFAGELEAFGEDFILANKFGFKGNYRNYLLGVNLPLSLLQEAKGRLSKEQQKDLFNQGLAYLRHVRRINPRSSSALYYLAKIQQVAPKELIPNDLESPEEFYKQALLLDRLHLGARMELASLYAQAGDQQKSLAILEEGFHYKYVSSQAMDFYGRLVQLYLQNGDIEGRKEAVEHMLGFQSRMQKSLKKQSKSMPEHLWGGEK